jgi:tetratricopeptide (TPR) repeat protein
MHATGWFIPLFLVLGSCLSTRLEPWFQSWGGTRARTGDLVSVALGDSRRLFAKQFYVKADAYFHRGYYPSIYDDQPVKEEMHMAANSGGRHESHDEGETDILGPPKDWIDRFSRNFFPSKHEHLDEGAEPHHEDHKPGEVCHHEIKTKKDPSRDQREILPWLRLAANLDPERPETYIVTSYWLRSVLQKVDEAEQFLREGLRHNPGNYELLFELGRLYNEDRANPERARNLWELALRNWRDRESGKPDPNIFPYAQILGQLATLEEKQQNYPAALAYLASLKVVSPYKASLQKWIADLEAKRSPAK